MCRRHRTNQRRTRSSANTHKHGIRLRIMEGYELQPTKSVILNISHKQRKHESNNLTFTISPNKMSSVESATHLGIIRTTSLKGNMTANVEENIKKARRSAYICSLFGGGFHGHNGLDVETIVCIYAKYTYLRYSSMD